MSEAKYFASDFPASARKYAYNDARWCELRPPDATAVLCRVLAPALPFHDDAGLASTLDC